MRIALAQLSPIVGDVTGNAALIRDAIDDARTGGADVLVTSELALLGYPPRDLILREGVVEACERAVASLVEYAGDLAVVIGHPRRCPSARRPFYNSATVAAGGQVLATYDKRLLPGYDVFDEDRYFHTGDSTCVVELAGRRVGVLICEDFWRAADVALANRYADDVVAQSMEAGCDVLLSLNASPFVLGKWTRHRQQVEEVAARYRVPVVMVNQAAGCDDLIFDGRSIVASGRGELLAALPGFEPCTRTIDLEKRIGANIEVAIDDIDPMRELYDALVFGLREYAGKTGHVRSLLGVSGGIDSALVAVIAAAAMGPENVMAVMLPSKYSSAGSLRDAGALAENLGLGELLEMSIEDLHDTARGTYRTAGLGGLEGVADENVQARLRGVLLMALSNSAGALLLATSNKSELAMGYATLYGDMCGSISVLGDVRKMQVYDLARWINEHCGDLGFAVPPIPEASISKPPSAELRADQTDQDTLPPYEVLDEIVERYIDREWGVERTIAETGFDADLVRTVCRTIDRYEFKRHQATVILKVAPRTFGRGRPYPLVMRSATGFEQATASRVASRRHAEPS